MSLAEKIGKPPVRERVVADCCVLIDVEVASVSGFSGLAVKAGYKLVKTFKSRFVPEVIDALLDAWVGKMEPYYAAWEQAAAGTLAAHILPQHPQVAEDLLSVTDASSQRTKHTSVKKMYERLRPSAKEHVIHALPGLAALIEKHAKSVQPS